MNNTRQVTAAFFVSLGLVILGLWIYLGFESIANKDRQVVVRGLAEREVEANKVTWPLVVKTLGNDLQNVYWQVTSNNGTVLQFLKDNGIEESEITVGAPSVNDKYAQSWSSDNPYRYTVTQVITVTSQQVDKVNALMKRQDELMKLGVALSGSSYEYQPTWEYTGLNDVKPEMIAEATRAAREAAQKFAEDSQSEIGGIKSASQGQFSITDRDAYTPWIKNVRVVTTITYELK
ncbi:MAG: SIMPL domain-containing protein [Muribaculaceae bacterium]|nr:SIMPL domain-containing protein [Muribaculaceae bacterium]